LDGRELLREAGPAMNGRLILTGGAAKSRAYRQILADLTGEPVHRCALHEAAANGAAVQAAAALTGRTAAEVAADWAPALEIAAEPQDGVDAAAARAAYRVAAKALQGVS
jgi:xylulokinase